MGLSLVVGIVVAVVAWRRRTGPDARSMDLTSVLWIYLVVLLFGLTLLLVSLVAAGVVQALPALALCLLLLFPWATVRLVLIPAGMPRTASLLTRLALFVWRHDAPGGCAIATVVAALRSGAASDLERARRRVASQTRVGSGAAVAAALLADHDDDRARARALMEFALSFDPRVIAAPARALATEWLIADDARAGRWADVARAQPASAWGSFVVGCAQRITEHIDAPSSRTLQLRWWRAGARVTLRPLLVRALASTSRAPDAMHKASNGPARQSDDVVDQALALHVEVTTPAKDGTIDIEQLGRLAGAWSRALPHVSRSMKQRAVQLGIADVERAQRTLDDVVVDALARALAGADLSTSKIETHDDEAQRLIEQALVRIRSVRADAFEMAATALRIRAEAKAWLTPLEELREFTSLRMLYRDLQRTGGEGRVMAWDACHWAVCEIAVHLWNGGKERRLGNAMFRWLVDEARVFGDPRIIETYERNLRCGP